MSKQDIVVAYGNVTEALGNSMFRVTLDNDSVVLCHLSGKMRKFSIRVLAGDRVKVELSIYDLTKGRISERIIERQVPSEEGSENTEKRRDKKK